MSFDRHSTWDEIEPSAAIDVRPSSLFSRPGEHEIELSKAISLKRIADALTGFGPSVINDTKGIQG